MKEIVEENSLKELIKNSSKILLVTRERPSVDGLAAMLALGRSLKENNKTVFFGCSGEIPEEGRKLLGIEAVSSELQETNLVLSFDYVEGLVEKVSYNIDGDRFNLILTGKDKSLDPSKIKFSNSGADLDLIIIVDTPKMEYLGKLLEHDQDLYSNLTSLNVDYHSSNTGHSTYKWVSDEEGSTSEIVFDMVTSLGLTLSKESAQLLLAGIKDATNNFEKNTTAETLERSAACLRAIGVTEKEKDTTEPTSEEPQSPDESWFAPKIYHSSKIIE